MGFKHLCFFHDNFNVKYFFPAMFLYVSVNILARYETKDIFQNRNMSVRICFQLEVSKMLTASVKHKGKDEASSAKYSFVRQKWLSDIEVVFY